MRQGRRLIYTPRIPRVERFLHGIAQSYSKFGPRSLVNHEAEEFTVPRSRNRSRLPSLWPSFLAFLISRYAVSGGREERRKEGEKKKKERRKNDRSRFRNFTRILKGRKRVVRFRNFPSRYADLFVHFSNNGEISLQSSYKYLSFSFEEELVK